MLDCNWLCRHGNMYDYTHIIHHLNTLSIIEHYRYSYNMCIIYVLKKVKVDY